MSKSDREGKGGRGKDAEVGGRMDRRMLFSITPRASDDSIRYVNDSNALGITAL